MQLTVPTSYGKLSLCKCSKALYYERREHFRFGCQKAVVLYVAYPLAVVTDAFGRKRWTGILSQNGKIAGWYRI